MTDNVVLDQLLTLEHAGWSSLCDSTGSRFYGQLMLPEAVMVLANGMVMDRDTVMASLADAPPWRTYTISDTQLIEVDADNAILVYTGTAYRAGAEPAFVGLMSSVYHRTENGWRLALYQQTPTR
ncbi:nuclear transport factor 2 family protein [Nocardia halotolerans]|uniref:Nuclear transport factor 2 family protein n=1 Tax=Nocardia halotolerans TaxID=1755878 RepID=A0ABV8VN81_9NOCA